MILSIVPSSHLTNRSVFRDKDDVFCPAESRTHSLLQLSLLRGIQRGSHSRRRGRGSCSTGQSRKHSKCSNSSLAALAASPSVGRGRSLARTVSQGVLLSHPPCVRLARMEWSFAARRFFVIYKIVNYPFFPLSRLLFSFFVSGTRLKLSPNGLSCRLSSLLSCVAPRRAAPSSPRVPLVQSPPSPVYKCHIPFSTRHHSF